MEKFRINSMGICENPETAQSFETSHEVIKILVATKFGLWTSGFDYEDKISGLGYSRYPCFSENVYRTKRGAIIRQIDLLLTMKIERKLVTELKDYRNTVYFEQLKLF